MSRRTRYVAISIVTLIVVALLAIEVIDKINDPGRVADMLNITKPPQSLHVVECASGPITDVIITCAIEVSPREFPLLLTGYDYSVSPVGGTSHSNSLEKVGPNFPVDVEYTARPRSFKNGGSVTVLANRERDHAIVDLYIE